MFGLFYGSSYGGYYGDMWAFLAATQNNQAVINVIEFYKGPPLATMSALTADMAFIFATGATPYYGANLEKPPTRNVGPALSVTITRNIPP